VEKDLGSMKLMFLPLSPSPFFFFLKVWKDGGGEMELHGRDIVASTGRLCVPPPLFPFFFFFRKAGFVLYYARRDFRLETNPSSSSSLPFPLKKWAAERMTGKRAGIDPTARPEL